MIERPDLHASSMTQKLAHESSCVHSARNPRSDCISHAWLMNGRGHDGPGTRFSQRLKHCTCVNPRHLHETPCRIFRTYRFSPLLSSAKSSTMSIHPYRPTPHGRADPLEAPPLRRSSCSLVAPHIKRPSYHPCVPIFISHLRPAPPSAISPPINQSATPPTTTITSRLCVYCTYLSGKPREAARG